MKRKETDQIRIDPTQRLCPIFDESSIAEFPVPDWDEMGVRVLDDCAQDHIM